MSARLLILTVLLLAPAARAEPFCTVGSLPEAPVVWPELPYVPGSKVARPPPPRGVWTWVNLWASWCPPCVDEIPRLQRWQEKMGGPSKLHLLFVNVEDDSRSVAEWLDRKPRPLPATAWLPPGEKRKKLLRALGVPTDATLPTQILVDPTGRVRCVRVEAVEDADFAAFERWWRAATGAGKPVSPAARRAGDRR